jgi:hypothetical protein
MWSKVLGKVTGVIGAVANFAPQLGGLITWVKSMISVGLDPEELKAVLGIRDLFRSLAQVLRDMASDCEDVADRIDLAVSEEGDRGTRISFEEGEAMVKEVDDFAAYPSRLKDISMELYEQIKSLTDRD